MSGGKPHDSKGCGAIGTNSARFRGENARAAGRPTLARWPRGGRRVAAGLLSMLLPGAGRLYAARRRGVLLLAITGALLAALSSCRDAALRARVRADETRPRCPAARQPRPAGLQALRGRRRLAGRPGRRLDQRRLRAGADGRAHGRTARRRQVRRRPRIRRLDSVFADDEPGDVLASRAVFLAEPQPEPEPRGLDAPNAGLDRLTPFRGKEVQLSDTRHVFLAGEQALRKPWVTILLLGTDRGPGNVGERTDTMIVAAIQRGTGRAVAFGVPRNLVELRLGGVAGRTLKRYGGELNGLYSFGRPAPSSSPAGTIPARRRSSRRSRACSASATTTRSRRSARLRGDGGRARRRGDPRQERLVDEVTRPAWERGRAEDRRRSRPSLPLLRPIGARLRALA